MEKTGYHNRPRIYELPHNKFQIIEPLFYEWEIPSDEGMLLQRVTVPASPDNPFIFDGASIPPIGTFITWLLPWMETIYPMGLHIYATAFHDWFWLYRGRVPAGSHRVLRDGEWVDSDFIWPKAETNRFFLRQLKEDGVGGSERNAMYLAVESPIGWYNWTRGKVPPDARPLK